MECSSEMAMYVDDGDSDGWRSMVVALRWRQKIVMTQNGRLATERILKYFSILVLYWLYTFHPLYNGGYGKAIKTKMLKTESLVFMILTLLQVTLVYLAMVCFRVICRWR